jgi:hypothetical protein
MQLVAAAFLSVTGAMHAIFTLANLLDPDVCPLLRVLC